ncbi:unnamed protein product [Parnassius apollo]|uniref:(apollo) hypothetical protein n=1 Tax=Parnassius apollo TaxID=110799 RepID=A0A8S3XPM4_PARAO|nr:unnamed protein product [Parnassius apollo]
MDDDQSSGYAVLVEEKKDAKIPDGPMIKLFESLVTNYCYKQDIILTNAQIIDILQVDFNIDIQKIHDVEVEIYVDVVKKYLKEWPEWDELERSIIDFKSDNNSKPITSIIEEKYLNLKKYLGNMLEIAKHLSPDVVKNIPKTGQMYKKENVNEENVVMEIQATRKQLNHLILRHPIGNNSIFNVNEALPKYYDYPNLLPLHSILSWSGIEVELKLKWAQGGVINLKYENCHKLQHKLVNKMLNLDSYQKSSLNQQWEVKSTRKNSTEISKDVILNLFEQCILNDRYRKWKPVLVSMHKILSDITRSMPSNIGVPGTFRKYLSKYSYVRFLYKNVTDEETDTENEKYDLQIQEVLSPMCQLYIGLYRSREELIKIHCDFCQVTFTGENVAWEIQNHFKSHVAEPDWQCVNCDKTITMSDLTWENWNHTCEPLSLCHMQ